MGEHMFVHYESRDAPHPHSDTSRAPLTLCRSRTYVRFMARASSLPNSRLDSLYESEGFGGEKTLRAKVMRELIDEIRILRRELDEAATRHPASGR